MPHRARCSAMHPVPIMTILLMQAPFNITTHRAVPASRPPRALLARRPHHVPATASSASPFVAQRVYTLRARVCKRVLAYCVPRLERGAGPSKDAHSQTCMHGSCSQTTRMRHWEHECTVHACVPVVSPSSWSACVRGSRWSVERLARVTVLRCGARACVRPARACPSCRVVCARSSVRPVRLVRV